MGIAIQIRSCHISLDRKTKGFKRITQENMNETGTWLTISEEIHNDINQFVKIPKDRMVRK